LRKPSLPSARCALARWLRDEKSSEGGASGGHPRDCAGWDLCQPGGSIRAFKKSLEQRSENRLSHTASAVENLSDREMHIFQLLGSGLGTRQIAHSLNLSVKTIESHRENIKRRLGLNSSRQLVARATRYLEETFLPPKKDALSSSGKKKVVRFPAA
jgi:DNA-binding CsgD family transcriptional regulator